MLIKPLPIKVNPGFNEIYPIGTLFNALPSEDTLFKWILDAKHPSYGDFPIYLHEAECFKELK